MNVFILCTGRSGSTTVVNACKFLTNYTAGHETLVSRLGSARLDYPNDHVEGDNRLSWMLGLLDAKYGKDAFYVHLKRDEEQVASSFNRRWNIGRSIIKAFAVGIRMQKLRKLGAGERELICRDYVDTVNANIEFFLRDKPNKIVLHMESIKDDFSAFWEAIEGQGDLDGALRSLDEIHNPSKESRIKRILK